ncbi:MAG: NADH-quinone oxidoreductase subunit J [Opitutae bacterium]|nr:NADH-quinone oxidoreductase subunit J [Opitutae bacterium]
MNVLAVAPAFPFADYLIAGIFLFFVAATVAGALIAACAKRIIRGVSGLALCSIGIAGLYYYLNSPFLALMQILIYVGAVCVVIVFGVMLSEPDEPLSAREQRKPYPVFGLLLAAVVTAAIFAGVSRVGLDTAWPKAAAADAAWKVEALGESLLSTYSLAFELISLVLLVAILGALAIARGGRDKE